MNLIHFSYYFVNQIKFESKSPHTAVFYFDLSYVLPSLHNYLVNLIFFTLIQTLINLNNFISKIYIFKILKKLKFEILFFTINYFVQKHKFKITNI